MYKNSEQSVYFILTYRAGRPRDYGFNSVKLLCSGVSQHSCFHVLSAVPYVAGFNLLFFSIELSGL